VNIAFDNDDNRTKIRAEEIRLWLKSPLTMAATVIFNLACLWELWDQLPHPLLASWAAAGLGWSTLRFIIWRRYASRVRDDRETIRWGHRQVLMLGVTGLITSVMGTQLFVPDNLEDQLFIVMGIGGLAAGAIAVYGAYLPAVFVFTTPLLLTLAATMYLRNEKDSLFTGSMVLVYLALLLSCGRILNRWVADIFRLRLNNERLAVELIAARDAAESANEAKSIFMANMSHELRTPLNAVIGFAEMLEKEMLGPLGNPRYIDYAHDVHMSGKHLLSLINTILDLSKNQAAHLELDRAHVDVAPLLRECFSVMRMQADKAGLAFTLDTPDEPLLAFIDETRLRQVIYNLLSNAIKFTDPGGAIVLAGSRNPTGGVTIRVTDSGVGMDSAELALALQPFMQVKLPGRRTSAGTGLGLPFAKAIVELHDGTLNVTSARGRGTAVEVVLPPETLTLDLQPKNAPVPATVSS
jgi:signal transduction histidine kinase